MTEIKLGLRGTREVSEEWIKGFIEGLRHFKRSVLDLDKKINRKIQEFQEALK